MRGVLHRAPWMMAGVIAIGLATTFACTSSDDALSSSSGNTGVVDGGDEDTSSPASSDASKDAKSDAPSKTDASTSSSSGSSGGAQLTIADGQSQPRFTKRSFSDYTCPEVPGLGKVVEWPIPQDIASATGLPAGGTYRLRVEGAAADNVVIQSTTKTYFQGDQPILITQTGSLPLTTLTAITPATGTVTLEGTWSCP